MLNRIKLAISMVTSLCFVLTSNYCTNSSPQNANSKKVSAAGSQQGNRVEIDEKIPQETELKRTPEILSATSTSQTNTSSTPFAASLTQPPTGGPFLEKRRSLVRQINEARLRGIGVHLYNQEYQDIEKVVYASDFSNKVESRLDALSAALTKQLTSAKLRIKAPAPRGIVELAPATLLGTQNSHPATSSLGNATQQMTSDASDLSTLPDEDNIPFHKKENKIFVNAELNGRPLEMLFDTGANGCSLGMNHLTRMGIDTTSLKGQIGVVGGSSGSRVGILIVPMTLKLGKTSRTIDIWIQANSPAPPLVGQNFLTGLQYEINNQLEVIRLKKSTNSAGKSSTETYNSRDRNAVPFVMQGKNIVVPVEVSGQPVSMVFDTGASGIVFPLQKWLQIRNKLKKEFKLIGRTIAVGIDGAAPTDVFVVDRVEFGPVALKDVKIFVSNPGPSMPLLGQDVLGGEKFIIDNTKTIIRFHR